MIEPAELTSELFDIPFRRMIVGQNSAGDHLFLSRRILPAAGP